jgi:hypothetical protein
VAVVTFVPFARHGEQRAARLVINGSMNAQILNRNSVAVGTALILQAGFELTSGAPAVEPPARLEGTIKLEVEPQW